ncbi:MAG: amidohydrolase [Candidatus Izimaplasma sp.]|nr:amidohydrolase [Candidatus Izimaplasma bacterium]
MDNFNDLNDYIIKHRRYLHMYPETGFNCKNTSKYIFNELNKLSIDEIVSVGDYSLIAIIRNGKGLTTGLRADFDALSITEKTDLDFQSKNKGKMHACGHDAHTAMLLGACKFLSENKDLWKGTIKFIFQEAEEGPSPGGALAIVKSGVVDDCDDFFAIHVSPNYETNHLAINYGETMAAADTLDLELIGKGAHAALPQEGIDPIIMQAEFILNAQQIVSRKISPMEKAVVTIAKVEAGTTHNVIPEKAKLKGTIRTFNTAVRETVKFELEELAKSIAMRHGGKYKMNYIYGYDPTINSLESTKEFITSANEVLGSENVEVLKQPMAGSEDFSRYINLKQGALTWLGVKQETKETYNIHHPKFNLNEDALILGTKIFIDIIKRRSE